MARMILAGLICVTCTIFASCESEVKTDEPAARFAAGTDAQSLAERGAEIFRDRAFGEVQIACADCHNDFPDSLLTTRIMPGHSILGAARRRVTWQGEFTKDALDAAAAGAAKCALIYQLRGSSLQDALPSSDAAALMEFYKFISTGNEPRTTSWSALSYPGDPLYKRDSILVIVDSLNEMSGNPERGEALFERACAFCHSGGSDAIAPQPRRLRRFASKVFLYVRVGKSNMPFFTYDKLSDQDVADIKEWIQLGAR